MTVLRSLRNRVVRVLRRSLFKPPPPPPTFFVDRYARHDLGSPEQLAAGSRDQAQVEPTDPAVLDRLIAAWRAMQADADDVPAPYQVSGEWTAIIADSFRPLTRALDAADHGELDVLLRNFFRRFGDFFGEPTDLQSEVHRQERREHFQMYASRWLDLYGEAELPDAYAPLISNPIGFRLGEGFVTADGLRHNFYARRIADLVDDVDRPVVCEVGGGFGGFAYHLLRRPTPTFRYIDYDLPVMCIVAGYYLLHALPEKELRLFGEVDSLSDPLGDGDLAILPNFVLPKLADRSAEVCFNTCSFAEMSQASVHEYSNQFERVARTFILYEDHSWTAESGRSYYEPMAGFSHWDLSAIQPSPTSFRRLHKIPAPFHSDFYGEFFEWLYERRVPEAPAPS
jgi:hypothetical protein